MKSQRILVLGAGIAGASTAWHLARRGVEVVLLEMEDSPDKHSSGRNAAILRTGIPDPALHRLAQESLDFFEHPPADFLLDSPHAATGLWMGATPSGASRFLEWVRNPACASGGIERPVQELYESIPMFAEGLAASVYFPREGTLDVSGIHQAFLRGSVQQGAETRLGARGCALIHDHQRILGIRTDNEDLEADAVVCAGGGWANQLAKDAGFQLHLTAMRRHLLVTEPTPLVDPDWPVAWMFGDEFYCRPESGGLLICACDEAAVHPEHGELVSDSAVELIAQKSSRWLPALNEVGAAHTWSGMRTFAQDQRFVLGPDDRIEGLYWAAGLGGHGMTCAPAVGRAAAAHLIGQEPDAEFLPNRPSLQRVKSY